MADWFFDSAATGTGSADTPADAGTNIISLWSYLGSAWTFGDKLWMRRSSVGTWNNTNSNWSMGRAGWNAQSHAYSWIVGWPKSGELFYEQRPVAGTSAGWDSDVNTVYGTNLTTLVDPSSSGFSRSHGFQTGMGLANVLFVNSAPANNFPSLTDSGPYTPKVNWHWVNYRPSGSIRNCRDLTVTYVGSQWIVSASLLDVFIDKLTFTESCALTGSLFPSNTYFRLKELAIQTNSLGAIIEAKQWPSITEAAYIGKLSGNRPLADVSSSSLTTAQIAARPVHVDDYFGEGPRSILGRRGSNYKTVVAGTVRVNSTDVLAMTHVLSAGGTSISKYNNFPHTGYAPGQAMARAREFVNWSSAADLVIRWPFLQVGSAELNVNSSGMPHFIHVLGLDTIHADVVPSSGFAWDGSSATGVGSAWVAVARYNPTTTGSGFADLMVSLFNPVDDEVLFYGRPEVNSA